METAKPGEGSWRWLRWAGWGGAVALILLPLVAMKVAPQSGVYWTVGDFVFAAVVIGIVGLLLELVLKTAANRPARLGGAMALGTGFLLIWSNVAVGYIGDGESMLNGVILVIPLLALIAAIVTRARAASMVWILAAAGIAHGVTGAIGYPQDPVTGPITIVFVGLWFGSAALFRNSVREA